MKDKEIRKKKQDDIAKKIYNQEDYKLVNPPNMDDLELYGIHGVPRCILYMHKTEKEFYFFDTLLTRWFKIEDSNAHAVYCRDLFSENMQQYEELGKWYAILEGISVFLGDSVEILGTGDNKAEAIRELNRKIEILNKMSSDWNKKIKTQGE